MVVSEPPYALFCTSEIPLEKLNEWLKDNEENEPGVSELFPVSSPKFDDAPKDGPGFGFGTHYPISSIPPFPFVGKTVEDCAKSLKDAPEEVTVDRRHFIVADEQSTEDGTVTLCKRGDMELKGDEISSIRVRAKEAAGAFSGLRLGQWEEKLQHWSELQRQGKKCMS